MSFDLYSYRSSDGKPSADEARQLIQTEENATFRDDPEAREIKERIAAAFIKFNPHLEKFVIDYAKVAEIEEITEEDARKRLNHIELNPPEGDLAIQLMIHWDHVSYSIPYWYAGPEADQVFTQLMAYLNVVKRTVGFLAYDPQRDRAFDPEVEQMFDNSDYLRVSANLPAIVAEGLEGKPWWKFW